METCCDYCNGELIKVRIVKTKKDGITVYERVGTCKSCGEDVAITQHRELAEAC